MSGTEEPGGLQSIGPQKSPTRLSDSTSTLWVLQQAGSQKAHRSTHLGLVAGFTRQVLLVHGALL